MRRGLLALILLVAAVACDRGPEPVTEAAGDPPAAPARSATDIDPGGTLTMVGTFDVDYMDPAAGYYSVSSQLHRGVSRTLVGYKATPDQSEQSTLVPDLATGTGTPNEDATEWTFTLKDGVRWGPALGGEDVPGVTGEEITSADIEYAVERIFMPSVGAQYAFYYDMIEGAAEFASGASKDISGIETPDDDTIVFRLTEPAGDWPHRMAMPATIPVPEEFASRYDKKKESAYDEHVVFTGPYYVDEWKPTKRLLLDRNEHWDPATDEIRGAYADRVEVTLGVAAEDAVARIQKGDFVLGWTDAQPSGPQLEDTVTDEALNQLYVRGSSGCLRYIYLNTAEEPFDDPDVRRAVAWAIDRANLKRMQGGPVTGPVATSVIPPAIGGFLPPEEFNPFDSTDMAGDMNKAKELLGQAGLSDGYDKEIFVVGASTPPHDGYFESVVADLRQLGFSKVKSKLPEFPYQYSLYGDPSKRVDIGVSDGWCKDYGDAYTFLHPLFHGDSITQTDNKNRSQLDDPRINEAIDEAESLTDPDERADAWLDLNRQVTEGAAIVPWSWDYDIIVFGPDAVGPYYHTAYQSIDWVNVGVASAES